MNVIPFVHEGLGNSSYLVEIGDGKAALVDPDRVVDRYLREAESRGWQIVSIWETHLHADFVSGALEAAQPTGARIFLPKGAAARFPHQPVAPGQRVGLDGAEMETIGSPGHTPEHLSYALRTGRHPPALFSGGSLIVGGAARTDLISPELTEPLTRAQYHTLKEAFAALPDDTLLYPTHGGGSFCSTGSGSERTSTLGRERAHNPLLTFSDEEDFVSWFPSTFPAVPAYFSRMRAVNQAGPRLRREIGVPPPLPPLEFDRTREGALVIDVRPKEAYAAAHIPESFFIAFRSSFPTWLGWLVPPDKPLLFVLGDVPIEAVVGESTLVGYERFAGWLKGGMEAWTAAGLPVRSTQLVDAATAREALADGAVAVDVRQPDEYASGHIEDALLLPLGELQARLGFLPKDRPIVTYCAMGDRSSSAASLLERAGFGAVLSLDGGMRAWRKAGYEAA